MEQFETGSTEEGPVSSFITYAAEGDILAKQGEYRKALDSYTKALELKSTDKNCLVARSKCHLQLGDSDLALRDANAALTQDKEFNKGLYQKAEALYSKGDFEYALVFYHRGNKLRPELDEFRLGIQKAREAIDNSIGSVSTCNLAQTWRDTAQKESGGTSQAMAGKKSDNKVATTAGARVTVKTGVKNTPPANDKTIKQLLGELYSDKEYLEKLKNDQEFVNDDGKAAGIIDLVNDGLQYLERRTEFWSQQNPMYSRVKEVQPQKARKAAKDKSDARSRGRNKKGLPQTKKDQNQYVLHQLQKINDALDAGDPNLSLRYANQFLRRLVDLDIPDKPQILGNIYSSMGSTYLVLDNLDQALNFHEKDLKIAKEHEVVINQSRALGNLGRVYARKNDLKKAVAVWTENLPLADSAVQRAWLHHDIGRCHLKSGQHRLALECSEKSVSSAKECGDVRWHLNGAVLQGEAYTKLGEAANARSAFDVASGLADDLKDDQAGLAVTKKIEELNITGTGDNEAKVVNS